MQWVVLQELYSHGYDEVGVMFASCPNFNDFYNEDAVNNNGLECIRFMNEILSDYDDLLQEHRFKSITKIKSIGSTYMAASGINIFEDSKQVKCSLIALAKRMHVHLLSLGFLSEYDFSRTLAAFSRSGWVWFGHEGSTYED